MLFPFQLLCFLYTVFPVWSWVASSTNAVRSQRIVRLRDRLVQDDGASDDSTSSTIDQIAHGGDRAVVFGCSRRDLLWRQSKFATACAVAACCSLTTTAVSPLPAQALVKGVAPPPKRKVSEDTRPKCTNIEECQALAERKDQLQREEAEASQPPALVTAGGTRYRDLEEGGTTVSVQPGDDVELYYKVLKLGKRSYDGLSGEGTVVFSRGYGLEDDEPTAGSKSFATTVGNLNNVAALNEALVGMKVGGVRRFAVVPQQGWRKPTRACDGGPGGSGTGGDLKTDYVVVPSATMVAEEACFDSTKQPFPIQYAQQRRMAQRFDQSLIMEVQVVSCNGRTGGAITS